MIHEPDHNETQLERLLRADAQREMSRTDPALADRFISGLGDAPPRRRFAPIVATGVCLVAVAVVGMMWSSSGRPHETPGPSRPDRQIAADPQIIHQSPIIAIIDTKADDLIEPLRREMRALAAVSRDSWRTITGLPPGIPGG